MAYICSHCQGNHPSLQCPTYPQFCANCNEEHPYGVPCYQSWQVEEDTSEIDARIAEEERLKNEAAVSNREAKRNKTYAWRKEHPEEYRAYMRDYMRRYRER